MKNIIKLCVSQLLNLWVMLSFIHHNPLMLWATGPKVNNVCVFPDATSWEDRYVINISGGSLTNITAANFFVMPLSFPGYVGVSPVMAWYLGTGAITDSELDNFPEGTVLFAPNIGTPTIYLKEGSSTWNAIT